MINRLGGQPNLSIIKYQLSIIPAVFFDNFLKFGSTEFDTDSIEQYFVQRLHEKIPTKAEKILNQLKRERGGNLQHRNYAERNQGSTEKWQIAQKLFALHFRRLKFESFEKTEIIEEKSFPVQQKLF